MKNASPKQLAIFASAILSVVSLAGQFILSFIDGISQGVIDLFLLPVVIFVASYFIFYYVLEKLIYRKIKVIYKNIHNLKMPSSTKYELDLNEDILSKVNQEVMSWAEDKKHEIDELKKNEKYRREFVGNVNHELKTPIFNIQGYIHTLLDGGIDDSKVNREYLYKASKSVDRLCNIIEDLEEISKLESGQLVLEEESFDICALTKEVFEGLEMQAEANHVHIELKEGHDKPIYVLGDKDRIRQVMINLISNGIKYNNEEGHVWVGFYDMDEHILTEVSDDGFGIQESKLPRVFERFYRIEKSRSRDKGGTGLGLSIVKHLIEAHGQTITVRSNEDVGSTFGFTLSKTKKPSFVS